MSNRRAGRGRPAKSVDPSGGPLAAFAHALRTRRLDVGLSIDHVARRAGCSPSILGDYERAERAPRDEQLVRNLADVLDLEPNGLIDKWRAASASLRTPPAQRPGPIPAPAGKARGRAWVWASIGVVALLAIGGIARSWSRGESRPGSSADSRPSAPPSLVGMVVTLQGRIIDYEGLPYGPDDRAGVIACRYPEFDPSNPPESGCGDSHLAYADENGNYQLDIESGGWWLMGFVLFPGGWSAVNAGHVVDIGTGGLTCDFVIGAGRADAGC